VAIHSTNGGVVSIGAGKDQIIESIFFTTGFCNLSGLCGVAGVAEGDEGGGVMTGTLL